MFPRKSKDNITCVFRICRNLQILKTRLILILNFTWPYAITYTNRKFHCPERVLRKSFLFFNQKVSKQISFHLLNILFGNIFKKP